MPFTTYNAAGTFISISWDKLGFGPLLEDLLPRNRHTSLRHQACYGWILRFFGFDDASEMERIGGIEETILFNLVIPYEHAFLPYLASSVATNGWTLKTDEGTSAWQSCFFDFGLKAFFKDKPVFLEVMASRSTSGEPTGCTMTTFEFIIVRRGDTVTVFSPLYGETSMEMERVGRALRTLTGYGGYPDEAVINLTPFEVVGLTAPTAEQFPAQQSADIRWPSGFYKPGPVGSTSDANGKPLPVNKLVGAPRLNGAAINPLASSRASPDSTT